MAGQGMENAQLGSKVGAVDSLIDNTTVAELNQKRKSVKFLLEIPHPTQFFTGCQNPTP